MSTVECPSFTESLRKYPPVPNLVRLVVKDYEVPELDIKLTKGMLVHIPVYAIQHDPEFYEDVSACLAKNLSFMYNMNHRFCLEL